MFVRPETGWRHVRVMDRHTKRDFAHCITDLVDLYLLEPEIIRVVLDNMNTHKPAALYEAFEPTEARRINRKLESHHAPKHGSWLGMGEIEFSVQSEQCLDRRLPDSETVCREIAAWEVQRNAEQDAIHWRFMTNKACTKLERLYPS